MTEEEDGPSERWLVSYADFITLLFAFFVVLYATSERDSQKTKEFEESVKKYLIKASGGSGSGKAQTNEAEKLNSPIEPPIPSYRQGDSELQRDLEEFVETHFKKSPLVLDIAAEEMGVRISFDASKVFAPQTAKFSKAGAQILTKFGAFVKTLHRHLLLEVYGADRDISSLRSTSSARFLISAFQLEPGDVISSSRTGEERLDIVILSQDAAIY